MPTKKKRTRTLKSHPLSKPSIEKKVEKVFIQLNFEKKATKGKLEPIWKTGTEEIAWCFKLNDSRKAARPYYLKNGDVMAIYDPNDTKKIIWFGKIALYNTIHYPRIIFFGLDLGRKKIHQKYQKGIINKKWLECFCKGYSAALVKGK